MKRSPWWSLGPGATSAVDGRRLILVRLIIPAFSFMQLISMIRVLVLPYYYGGPRAGNENAGVVGGGRRGGARSVAGSGQPSATAVQFLAPEELTFPHDAYSGAWWQSRESFLAVDVDGPIGNAEGAIFANLDHRRTTTRMTVDWLDLSVEHLSKWWKWLEYDTAKSEIPYHRITRNILSYLAQPIEHGRTGRRSTSPLNYSRSSVPAMNETVAVIAFSPEHRNRLYPMRGLGLSVTVLAATVFSLVRQGCGRIVVAGEHETDWAIVQGAYGLVEHFQRSSDDQLGSNSANQTEDWYLPLQHILSAVSSLSIRNVSRLVNTDVAFVRVNATFVAYGVSTSIVPKAVLMSVQESLRPESSFNQRDMWLGSGQGSQDWKYVYYTEHDCILQTRSSAMPRFREVLSERDRILVPHRLQPIWHESDLRGYEDSHFWVPAIGSFSNVIALDSNKNGSCCDDGINKPMSRYGDCGNFWYMCGFEKRDLSVLERVKQLVRLQEYSLMRLTTGTGIVSLAATEHGRRCVPRAIGTCRPELKNASSNT